MQCPGRTTEATPDTLQKQSWATKSLNLDFLICEIPVSFFPSLIHPLLQRRCCCCCCCLQSWLYENKRDMEKCVNKMERQFQIAFGGPKRRVDGAALSSARHRSTREQWKEDRSCRNVDETQTPQRQNNPVCFGILCSNALPGFHCLSLWNSTIQPIIKEKGYLKPAVHI